MRYCALIRRQCKKQGEIEEFARLKHLGEKIQEKCENNSHKLYNNIV